MNLTPSQKRILLVLCDAAENCKGPGLLPRNGVKLRTSFGYAPVREAATGCALVRKGAAERLANGNFVATLDGFWEGDALRIEDRQGKIPARRVPEQAK